MDKDLINVQKVGVLKYSKKFKASNPEAITAITTEINNDFFLWSQAHNYEIKKIKVKCKPCVNKNYLLLEAKLIYHHNAESQKHHDLKNQQQIRVFSRTFSIKKVVAGAEQFCGDINYWQRVFTTKISKKSKVVFTTCGKNNQLINLTTFILYLF